MLHRNMLVADGIHGIHSWEPADTTALLAIVVVEDDIGKVARKIDTAGYYILTGVGPAVWQHIGSSDGYTLPIATASVLGGIKIGAGFTIDPATGILIPDATIVAELAVKNAFTKNQYVTPSALVDAANIAVNASLSNNFKVTLAGNRALDNPTNLVEGMVLNFTIDQDATGGRTLSYGTLYKFPGGTVPVLSTAVSAKDFMSCYYDGTILRCNLVKAHA